MNLSSSFLGRLLLRSAFALPLVMTPNGSAQAKNWPSVGWFDITETDEACAATAEYSFDGRPDVHLFIAMFTDNKFAVTFTSSGWSAEKGKIYDDIAINVNGSAYTGEAKGIIYDYIYKGFLIPVGEDFIDDFSKGSSLYITKGDEVVTHINLYSSGKAVSSLR